MAKTLQILDQSMLIPNKFQLAFPRVSNTVFYCTRVNIPSLQLSEAITPNPFTDLYVPGDKITFGTLDVIFVVDAALNGWQDIYTWMTGLGFPENFDQYANLASQAQRSAGRAQAINTAGVRPPYSDAILNIYTSKNNPSLQFSFKDCFPLALGAVQFDYGQSADEVLTCDAQFRYSYYNFTPTS